jgi:uncharacterized protein (DUF433 family)
LANRADGESVADLAYIFECPVEIVRAIIEYARARS